MKSRGIWIASLVLAALCAIYYYSVRSSAGDGDESKQAAKLLSLDAGKVSSITIKRGGETIALEKAGDDWKITSPVTALAESGAVDEVINAAAGLGRGQDIGPAQNLGEFGLDDPAIVTFVQSGAAQTLKIGSANPSATHRYVMIEGTPVVYLAGLREAGDILKSLFDLRNRKLFRTKLDDVKSFTVKKGDAEITVLRGAGWTLSKPDGEKLDMREVENHLSKTLAAVAEAFIEEGFTDMKQYGLDKPAATITVNSESLLIGSPAVNGGRYATVAGSGTLIRIPDGVYSSAPDTPDVFYDMSLAKFDISQAARLLIQTPQWKLAAEAEKKKKDGDETRWKLIEPQGKEADAGAIESYLFELERARGLRLAKEGDAALPDLKITVTAAGKDHTIGLFKTSTKGSARYYALAGDGGRYVETDSKTFETLNLRQSGFFDSRYFPVRPDEVGKIVIDRNGQLFEMARIGDNYKMLKPESRGINPEEWNAMVWPLTALKCEATGAAAPRNKPAIVISVYDTLGNLVDEVSITGRAPGGGYFAAASRKRGANCGVPERFVTGGLITDLENMMTR